jgi:siroheme synthase-like protein
MTSGKIKPIPYFPVFLNLRGKRCVVIGGGKVALRKVKILLECKAEVEVISPDLHPNLARLVKKKGLRRVSREYRRGDLDGAVIVIAATDVQEVNDRISQDAKRRGSLVNVVDDPELSDFILPSFFRKNGLILAVSTSGKSPALARKIRTRLEKYFGEEYAALLSLIEEVRSELKQRGIKVRPEAWQRTLDLDLLIELVKMDQREKARAVLLGNLRI